MSPFAGKTAPPPGGRGSPLGALRPLGLGDVLDGMFRLLVRQWRAYLLAVSVVLVPVLLLSTWLQRDFLFEPAMWDVTASPEEFDAAFGDPAQLLRTGVITFFLQLGMSLLVIPFVQGVAARIASCSHLGEPVRAGDALRVAGRRYFALLGVNLVRWGLVAAAGVALFGLVFLMGVVAGPLAAAALGFLSLLLWAAAWVVVFTLLIVATPMAVIEGCGPLTAVSRSSRLVRQRFWAVLGIGLLMVVIVGLIATIIATPLQVPAMIFPGAIAALTLAALSQVLATVVTAPLRPNAYTLMYYDLRVRFEGIDLESMVSAIEEDAPG